MNIAVVGCGKMGRMIEAVCARREDVQIAGLSGGAAVRALTSWRRWTRRWIFPIRTI